MTLKQNDPLEKFTGKNIFKIIASAIGGGILSFIAITILFGLASVIVGVSLNLQLPIEAGMNANLLYSCLVTPIIIIIISAVLILRKGSLDKTLIASWLGIIILGISLTLLSSAMGGTELAVSPQPLEQQVQNPNLYATQQLQTAVANFFVSKEATETALSASTGAVQPTPLSIPSVAASANQSGSWLLLLLVLAALFLFLRFVLRGRYLGRVLSKIRAMNARRKAAYKRREEQRALEIQANEARRQAILSGQIEPIQVLVNLEPGEKAFVEVFGRRMAIVESVVEKTVSKTDNKSKKKRKGVITRSIIGTVIAGPVGTLVGGLTAGTEGKSTTNHESETKQYTVSTLRELDSGRLIFTDKRIILLGNEIVSIPYRRLIAVTFKRQWRSQRMDVKYEGMLKSEHYILSGEKIEDIDIYYRGITQNLLGA